MGTTRSFQSMLNQYLPNDLLKDELVKRDWVLQNVDMDDSWLGGDLVVAFKGVQASSVAFGSLTASDDVAESAFVRGSITSQPEAWGTMVFNHRDIMEHGKVSEQNFLKVLPDEIDDFLDYMKQVVSLSLLNGPAFAKLTVDGVSDGTLVVDRIERFVLKQKIYVDDDNSSPSAAGYVQSIDINTSTITVDTTRAGGVDLNLAAYTVAQNAKVYFDGSQSNGFTSLRQSLLSATNGGSSTLYGQTKTAYPFLQSVQISGAAWTASTFLQGIFDAYVRTQNRGKGMPNKAVMSYLNLGFVMTTLESQKGAYHIEPGSTKVNAYGWTEIVCFGPKGRITLVGIQEMENDVVFLLDTRPNVMKIYSNGGFRKRQGPDGREYFEVRATTGYSYLLDTCFFGDFVLLRPSCCGIVHDISIADPVTA